MPVKTKYGTIEGIKEKGYTVYKGIPYAKSPVGELRFKAPEEPEQWDGVYKAEQFPAKCPQEASGFPLYVKEFYSDPEYLREESEDGLYLNIWVPEGAQDLPVAFWIHGGGFGGGYGSEIEFDGETFCEKDIILVTIQYRVNIYGFLAHPWLSKENSHGISGNYGILDQIAALKWVRENIAVFGGSPDNITVFGQSAGSSSVQILVSTPLTENWISKAALQSGGSYNPTVIDAIPLKEAERIGQKFIDIAGVKNLDELRALSSEEIQDYRRKFEKEMRKETNELVLIPNVDGYVLPDSLETLARQGDIKNIPYMIGSTQDDLFVTKEELAAGERGALHEGCKNWSLHMEELGRDPSYVYYFKHHLPGDNAGAFHSSELWYVFGTLHRCWRPMETQDYHLSEQMVSYWTNFMKTGEPGLVDGEEWKPHKKTDTFIKVF